MRLPKKAAPYMRFLAVACATFCCSVPARASFTNGQAADLVIGQPTFNVNTANNNPGGTSLNSPYGVWVSTRQGQTFVADYNNHRVLIYNTTSPVNGRTADFVLGQPDMFRNTPNLGGVSAWAFNGPISVYVYETATSTQLFVADYSNHRILVWNGIPSTNTVAADFVLGQTGFAANSAASDAVGLYNPNSMVVNAGRLYIADYSNHRVKIHNFTAGAPFPTANGPSGDNVLGQSLLGGCVWWGHHYNCSSYANNGHDNAFPNAFWYPFDLFVSTPAGKTLVVDGQNNRVLVYNSTWPAVVASTANAALVLGQPDFQKNGCNSSGGPTAQTLCQPSGVWVSSDGVKVAVTDEENHRVLIWNSFPTVNGQAANVVVGQANMTSRAAGSGSAQLYAPMKAFYDPVSDQFFVSDWNNHRVWVKNGFPATDGLSADFVLGQNATIGSAGANRGAGSPDATTLYSPRAAAAGRDSGGNNYLYVSDHYNYRVLAYSLPITQNAQGAFRVLGQPDFVTRTQNNGGTSASSLGSPVQLFYSSGSLYVSDGGNWCTGGQGNNRVLVFTSSITANQQAADRVIGQPGFTTNGCNQGGISGSTLYGWWDWPGLGVWASDEAVVVADPTNHRVLFYRPITGNGQAAAAVLGQPGFGYNDAGNRFISNKVLYAPTSVTTDGQNLFVADYVNHRVLGWRLPITVNQQPADYVLGQASFTFPVGSLAPGVDACNAGGISEQSLCYPNGVFASSSSAGGYKLYVGEWSNNRVLVWTSTVSAMRQGATFALGQPVTTSNACNNGGSVSPQTLCNVGRQLWADEKALSVPDTSNNRVLRYFPPPAATNGAAGSVLGQPTMTGNTPFSGASPLAMNSYYWSRGVVSDGARLATVDAGNNRVMIWNSLPTMNGQGADVVLGQASMSDNACNQGGLTGSSLCNPYGLHWDGRQFFVADTGNHRILVWNRWPTSTGQAADYVIGQAGFNTQSCNLGSLQVGLCTPEGLYSDGHRLWVADWSNHRVVAYALPITANQPPAVLELGQPASSAWTTNGCNQGGITASSLCNPSGVHFDGERLFVADYSNNRVLQWNARPTLNGQGADIVLGQPNSSANACNNGGVTAQTMCCPAVPYSDGARLYVSDLCNHRTMIWNSPPAAPQQAADGVLGRGSLTVGGCCEQTANSQTYPDGSILVGNTLWQQDNWYHRVLRYTSTATNLFAVSITSALVPSSVSQSTVPAPGFRLVVSAPSSGLTWTRLTLYNNSNLLDNSLQARLYKEASGNATLDSGDTAISAQVSLSNGKATLFFSQPLNATLTTYYIGLYANSASLPYGPAGFPQGALRVYHNLHSFGFAQSGVELAGNAPVGLAYNSGFFGPVDAPDYVVFAATTGAAFSADLVNTSTGIVVASLTLGTANDYAFMTSLAVNRLGSASDSDIAGLTLWQDNNTNGLLDAGDVNLTSSSSPFAGGVSFVSPSTPLEISTFTRQYLLVADFAGTAQNVTFGVNLDTASFALHGADLMSPASTAPFSSSLSTLRPAVPVIQSQVPTAWWWNSTFTFTGNLGQQGVSYFRTAFDQNPTHAWTDTESRWTIGSSTAAAASPAQNWYLHARAYNSANQGGGAVDLGPFWADPVLPSGAAFARYSAAGGWIPESSFDRLTQGVTVQITAQDANSGLALNFRSPAGRVGLWTFNEGVGLTSLDLTGNGNTAILSGSGLWSSGYEGSGLTLAGNPVDISTPSGVSWAGGFTMLGWVRPTCSACGYQTAWASTQFRFQYHSSAGMFQFRYESTAGGGCAASTGYNWPVNAWHHVALVVDPAGGQNRIYINGQLASSCGAAGSPVNTRWRLGSDGVSGIGGTDPFNGSQDNLAIFNAALSEAQIQTEMNSSRPAFPVVFYSTTAGAAWNVVSSTLPGAGPYVGYSGATGATSAQTLAAVNLSLAQSTNAVVCAGGSFCSATNQVKFSVLDAAGNVRNAGPFSVLVDAFTPIAISSPSFPSSGTWANASADFQWTGPSTTTLTGLGAGAFYLLEVSNNDPAFAPANVVISISTPVAPQVSYGSYLSTYSLANLTTYYWRVAARNVLTGNTSPWSLTHVFRTDYSSAIASGFARTSSTGGLIGESTWDTLASGASVQLTVQDLDSGLTLSALSGGATHVEVSTTTGSLWTTVSSTVPAPTPYFTLGGSSGTTAAQTIAVHNLELARSTNVATCGGAGPCTATNQVRFVVSDVAGNLFTFGPFALRVDTPVDSATPTLASPINGAFTGSPLPVFSWLHPGTTVFPGIGAFHLELSSEPAMTPLVLAISTPAYYGVAAGSYASTATLSAGTTYYWRVRPQSFGGAFGPYSQVFSFRTDFAPPAASEFLHFDSTGGAFLDYQFNNLASGVTAQVTAQDALTGLNLAEPPDAATAALWQFEEGVGAAARNSANGGSPATFAGGAGWGAGRWGGGAVFDGVNDYASAPHAAGLNLSNAMTLGAWIKPAATVGADTTFVHKGNGNFGYTLSYASGKLAFWAGNGSALSCGLNAACVPANLAAGVWAYAAGTYDGVTLRLYLNGALVDSVIYTGGIGTNSDPLILGSHAGTAKFFNGVLDDVRLFTYARSAAQVQADAVGASPPLAMFSNDAGWNWTVAGATYPVGAGAPYVSIGGTTGTTAPQTYQLRNLRLVQSTSTFTGALATNQVKFLLTDVAGNVMASGPYAVLFDSSSLTVVSTPTLPVHGGYVSTSAPSLIWKTPNLDAVVQYAVQVASVPTFAVLTVDITTPAVTGMALGTHTVAGLLLEDVTYYWRVQARTNLNRVGPWSSSSTFVTDFTPPSSSAYAYLNSAGLPLSEGQFTDLATGVTAQLRAQDLGSGLSVKDSRDIERLVTPRTVGLWHFNEGSGATAVDATGLNTIGSLNGTTWTNGRFVSAISFANAAYLYVGSVPMGSTWTLEAWTRFPLPTTSGERILAYNGNRHVSVDAAGMLGVYNGGFFSSGYDVDGLSGWHRLTAVGSGGSTSFYIDGTFVGAAASQVTSAVQYFGNAASSNLYWGALDEVRVLNYAASAAEIQSESPYFVWYSTTAGSLWNLVASTTPASTPYVSLSGAEGSRAAELLTVYDLPLVQSTNTTTCGGGAAPCGASNQVRFGIHDRSGNVRLSGPYAILIDTTSAVALSTTALPSGGTFVQNARPGFVWNTPNPAALAGLTSFYLEASRDPGFSTLDVTVSTPNLGFTAAAYASTHTLTDGSLYYWRVRSRNSIGNFSPYSGASSFTMDLSSPAAQGFASLNLAGAAIGEPVAGDVLAGATVQLTLRDQVAGLAGAGGFGVMMTTNAAQSWIDWSTWTAVLSGTGETGVLSLAAFNGRLYGGTYPNARVYSSPDGVGWTYVFAAAGEQNVRSLSAFNGKLYAGTYPGGKIYSTPDGTNWTQVYSTGTEIWSLVPFNGRLYAGLNPGATVVATADGVAWSQAFTGAGQTHTFSLAAFNGRLYAGTGPNGRVYSSADGATWSLALSGTGESEVRSLAVLNGRLYAGTGPNGRVYSTADGANWSNAPVGAGETYVMSLAALNGKLYAGAYPGGKVYATADGNAWVPVLPATGGGNNVEALAGFGKDLYVGTVNAGKALRLVPLASSLSGAAGSTNVETLTATGLSFAPSANSGQVCAGLSPCSATNQVIFTALDRAGNALAAGPYAVIIDTTASRAQPIPILPSGLGGAALRPEFAWTLDPAVSPSAVRGYQLDLASSLDFVGGLIASSSTANRYASFPFDLSQGTTYYWRSRAFSVSGGTSPFCAPQSVTIDASSPTSTGFASVDALGMARPETEQLDLNSGVTVQLTIQDPAGGLQRDGPAPLAPIPGTALLWRLDDVGSSVIDGGLLGNDGSLTGSVARVTGRFGSALRFDGTGGYASVPYNASLSITSVTLQAWVNTYAPGPGWIVGQDGGSFDKFALYLEAGGTVTGMFGDFSVGCAGPAVTDGRWHQLAITRDGTGRAVYVDGTLCASGAAVGMAPGTQPFVLGRRAGYPGPYYQGVIDDVRVVARALSAAEIAADYAVGAPFAVQWSTNAGASWSLTSSTIPGAAPYLRFPGTQFDTGPRLVEARQLSLATSTNAVVCAGARPCGATNQVRFYASDRAGNVHSAGPFSVLVDTQMARPAAAAPAAGGFVNSTAPVFSWSEPNAMPRHEVQVSSDAFATLVFSSNTANPTAPSSSALAHATAYSWRVRAFNGIGLATPYSPPAAFTVDVVPPAIGSFASFSSTGVVLDEGEANDLPSGATIRLGIQDLVAGLPAPEDPGPPFSVQWSTNAGAGFQLVTATYPAAGSSPYLVVSGPAGSTAPEQFEVRGLSLAASTSPAICAGAQPCAATNQLRFTYRDRAGNVRAAGPYAVLIDTIARQATPILVSPSSWTFVPQSRPALSWGPPPTAASRDIRGYHAQVALDPAFQTLVFDEPSLPSNDFQVPFPLLQGATYFWRARSQSNGGFLSPYSSAAVFMVDAVGPAMVAGSFASFDSAGIQAPESGANDLLSGVTAQLRLSDPVSGLGAPSGPGPASQTAAEWPLDEGAGTAAADVSGGGNTGTMLGPKWITGRIGAALWIDGDNAALQAPAALGLPAGFTFEAWVQPQGTTTGSRGAIMGQGNSLNQAYLGLPKGVGGLTGDVFNAWMTDSGSGITEAVASTVPFVPGRWYHLAATYAPGRLRLYVDGVLAAERAVTSTSGSLPFMVGRHYSLGHFFKGAIDHPRVLSRELDAASVAADYRRGAASPFYVELSTNAGGTWSRIDATVPWTSTTPYLSLTGAYGSAGVQTLQARNLQLARSTTSGLGSLGTNQLRFSVYDVAGASSALGPFAIIVDTIAPSAVPLLAQPAAGAFVRQAQPAFRWSLPATTNPFDITGFHVQVATTPAMAPLLVDEADVTASPLVSPLALAGGTTYYWRARSRSAMGTFSPFSSTSSFRVDLAGPALSGFVSFTSTSVPRGEGLTIDLAAGVTAQLTATDAVSGLVRPTAPQAVPATALYWHLDEVAGAAAPDSSGSGNAGTLQGGAAWTDGRVGAGLSLNGVDGFAQGADPSIAADFTLEAWVKPVAAAQSGRGAILGQGSGSAQMYLGLPNPGQGAPYVGGRFNFWLTDGVSGTPAVVASTFAPVAGTWYHVAAVYEAGRMKLYVNGELQQDMAYGRGSTALPFYIGRSNGPGGDYFAGVVDEARVVASALSAAQLRRDYSDAAGTPAKVEVSTDAGATWTRVERTYRAPGLPYLEYGWTQGATAALPLKVVNLSLVQSTSTATGSQGTNQLRFTLRDVADNQSIAGPYAVLVDSVAPAATPLLLSPTDLSLSPSSAAVLTWALPAGIGSIRDHDVQVSLDPGFASLAQSTTTPSRSFIADGLSQGSTYYWRVRARTTILGTSPFSAPFAVVIDTIAPAISSFRSYNSTGGALAETQWNTLLSGVTVSATVQQAGPGARGLSVSTGSFFVEVSSDAGRNWRIIASTWPAAAGEPYLTLTGSSGTTLPQVMTVYGLAVDLSTSGALGTRGTNLVRLSATSVSGKRGQATFSVLVDTVAPSVPAFASIAAPAEGQILATLAASTDPLSGLHAQPYDLHLSSDGFATLLSSTGWIQTSSATFSGLPHGVVYSLRARARDALDHVSTFSAVSSFNLANKIEATALDVAQPAALQGQPAALLRLQLYNAGGSTPWESLRLTSLGDADADVQELLLYSDSNANGAFDPPGSANPDVQLSPPGLRFTSGIATLRPTSAQTITPSTQTFFVAARVDALAAVGNRMGVRIENATAFEPIFARAASFPIASGLSVIEPGPAVVTFTPFDLTPPTIPPGTANVPLLRLLAVTDRYTAEIASFTVTLTTGAEADLSTLKVFKDDGDGDFDAARDTLISGGGGQFANRVATVTLTGTRALRTVTPTVSAFFLAADVSAAAGEGNVASFSIPSSTWVRLASSTNSVAATNFPANTIQTAFVTQNTLRASLSQLESAGPSVFQGGTYTFARLDLRTDIGVSGIDRLTLTRAGLSFDTDVAELAVWRDQDANGVFSTSLDAFLASATFSGGAATLSFASQAVQVSTATFFLRLKVHAGALDGNTVGFKLANTAAIRPTVGYTVVEPSGFPLSTLTPTIRATVNTVSVSALDVAPGSALQGARDVPLMRLALQVDRNLARVNAVRLDLTGSVVDADLRRVKVYEGPPVFSVAASTLVSSGLDILSSGTVNAFLLLPLAVTPTTSYAYLVADVAADAVVGRTFGLAVSTTASLSLNAPNVVSPAGFPVTSAQVSIQRFPDTVRAYGRSLALPSAPAGQADLLVQKLVLQTSLVDVDVRQVRVSKAGTLTDGEVSDLRLWRDANGDGALDIFSDVLVTTQPGRFVGGVATLPLTGARALPAGATYLMLLSLSTSAAVGRTVSLSLPADSLLVDSPASADYSNYPLQTSAVTVAKPAVTMNVTGRSLAPASATQGLQNVPMLKLELAAQAHFVDWNRLALARLGSGTDLDVTNLRVYHDSNGDGTLQPTGAGADTLVSIPGTQLLLGGAAAIALSTQTIATSSVTYFVALDLSATAPAGNTIALQVVSPSGLRLVPADVVASAGFPITSSFTTIAPTLAGVFFDVQDAAPPSLLQGATRQLMASLSLRTTNYAALWSSLKVTRTGTAQDNDIAGLSLWHDANDNFQFEPGTDTLLTSGGDRFIGGTATLQLASREVIQTVSRRYFLAVDANLYAEPGRTFGVRIASATHVEVDSPNYTVAAPFPTALGTTTLTKLKDTLYAEVSDAAPTAINQGYENELLKVRLWAARDRVNLSQWKVGRTGTISDSDVASVGLYGDNGNGIRDPADVLLASTTLAGGQALFRFSPPLAVLTSTGTYWVTYKIANAAPIGRLAGMEVSSPGYFTLAAPDVAGILGGTLSSSLPSISDVNTPVMPTITLPSRYWPHFNKVEFVWVSTVGVGPLVAPEFAVGTAPRGIDVVPWSPLPGATPGRVEMPTPALTSGVTHYISVRVKGMFGQTSPVGTSDALLIDYVEPPPPAASMTPGDSAVLLSWSQPWVPPSGVMGFLVEYRTGSTPQWKNAKTGKPSPAVSSLTSRPAGGITASAAAPLESFALAISSDELVQGTSFVATPPQGTVFIRIRTVSGSGVLSDPTDVTKIQLGPLPKDGLSQVSNYPNPFDSRKEVTKFNYVLSANSDVTIKIFSLFGTKITELKASAGGAGGQAGSNDLPWDGTDSSGRRVAKGLYLAVIEAGGAKVTQKVGVIH